MSPSNKVGFVLLCLIIGWAVAFCGPTRHGEPEPTPVVSVTVSPTPSPGGLRHATQSPPSPAVPQ